MTGQRTKTVLNPWACVPGTCSITPVQLQARQLHPEQHSVITPRPPDSPSPPAHRRPPHRHGPLAVRNAVAVTRARTPMSALAFAAFLVVACASCTPVSVGARRAKVTKCCPRDTILRIDMGSCTEYVPGDQNDRESYAWTSSGQQSAPDLVVGFSARTPVDDVKLSLANSTSVPWSVL